jgi:hypothetical protein
MGPTSVTDWVMPPTNAQARVKDRLMLLLNGIRNSDAAAISGELAGLEEILEIEEGALPPELTHLLRRRSYAKAYAFLGGEMPAK